MVLGTLSIFINGVLCILIWIIISMIILYLIGDIDIISILDISNDDIDNDIDDSTYQ